MWPFLHSTAFVRLHLSKRGKMNEEPSGRKELLKVQDIPSIAGI